MKDYLKTLPRQIREIIRQASSCAWQSRLKAYLVGGFVRDALLGVPNLDLDIVVEGDGIAFADKLSRVLKARVVRHRRFGTATLHCPPRLKVDVATIRREYYPQPGHLPVVEPGVLKEDLFRRDFTINAMAIDITRQGYGNVIDFFGGKEDLRRGIVRVLHEVSFLDDPTRIMRAVRFEQRYRFRIERKTLRLLKEAVGLDMLSRVDAQRIRDDLVLVLKESCPPRALGRLYRLAGFSFLSPSLGFGTKTRELLGRIGKQLAWFEDTYAERRQVESWLVYFMGITCALDDAALARMMRSLGLRKQDEKRALDVRKLLADKRLCGLRRKDVRPSVIYRLFEPHSYEALLFVKAVYKDRWIHRHIEDFFEIYNGMRISISGHDVHALGMKPGPVYQKIFSRVLHAKLDGKVTTRDEEIALIRKIVRNLIK